MKTTDLGNTSPHRRISVQRDGPSPELLLGKQERWGEIKQSKIIHKLEHSCRHTELTQHLIVFEYPRYYFEAESEVSWEQLVLLFVRWVNEHQPFHIFAILHRKTLCNESPV